MLEEVGEAGAVLRLDPEADVEVDRDDRHGGRRVAREHDLQAVRRACSSRPGPASGRRRPPPRPPGPFRPPGIARGHKRERRRPPGPACAGHGSCHPPQTDGRAYVRKRRRFLDSLGLDREDFRPAAWLPGPHLQTVFGRLVRSRRLVPMRREALTTPDGDELLVDHVDGRAGSPRVIVLHGLEGSSNSVYAQGLLFEIRRRGWRGAAMNFRSCARDPADLARMLPNRRPRMYHSGETGDLDFLARTLAEREPGITRCSSSASLSAETFCSSGSANRARTLPSTRPSRSRRPTTLRPAPTISRRCSDASTRSASS